MKTIEAFTSREDRTGIFTPVMLAHQKNNEGNDDHPRLPAQGLLRAKGLRQLSLCEPGVAGRGNQDRRGALPPQPPGNHGFHLLAVERLLAGSLVVVIDYYGRWKALQYYARRFYAPILVSPHVEDGSLKVYIVSDKSSPCRPYCACA
jgi:beta-mannosidase